MKKSAIQTFISLVIIVNIMSISFGQTDTSLYIKNPDRYVAEQLLKKRIVMLGDFHHNAAISLSTPIKVLEEWLKTVNEYSINSNLTLVLEIASNDAEKISNFIKTGNLDTLLDMVARYDHLENLEFYTKLKDFYKKIEMSNAYKENRITFKIKGFEIVGYEVPEEFKKKTAKENQLWFVNQRDSLLSVGITNYLNENTEETALIFYGAAHLQKGYVKKRAPLLTDEENKGFYIAHYLKHNFGDENVLTVTQITNPAEYFKDKQFAVTQQFDIYVKSINIPWKQFDPDYYDAFILRKNQLLFFPHLLNLTLSRFVIEQYLNDSDSLFSLYFLKFYFDLYLGEHFNNLTDVKNWYINNKDKISLSLLDSQYYSNKIFKMLYKDTSDIKTKDFVHKLGSRLDILQYLPDSISWHENLWPEELKHIKFINSVGIYWVGYPDEKIIAKKYMVEFSGQEFLDAYQYFKWYRKKYYDYDF